MSGHEESKQIDTSTFDFPLPEAIGTPISPAELSNVIQKTIEIAADALGLELAAILCFRSDRDTLQPTSTYGFSITDFRDIEFPLCDAPLIEAAFNAGKAMIGPAEAAFSPDFPKVISETVVVIPMVAEARRVAVLVGKPKPDVDIHSSTYHVIALEMGKRLTLVAECHRLQTAYLDLLRNQADHIQVLNEILDRRPLSLTLNHIMQHIAGRLRASRIVIYSITDGVFVPLAVRNIAISYAKAAAANSPNSPLFRRGAETKEPFVVEDIAEIPELAPVRDIARRENVHTALLCPLRQADTLEGIMAIYPTSRRNFTPVECQAAQLYANQAAIAIAMYRLLQHQHDSAIADERSRLARDIHDTVAQKLSTIILEIEGAEIGLGSRDITKNILDETLELAREALNETRRALAGLSADLLGRTSLSDALRQELDALNRRGNYRVQYAAIGDERPIGEEKENALFRIAQETLHNIHQHAQAGRIRMALRYEPDRVTLTIEDDGVGFEARLLAGSTELKGFGLKGMQERAHLYGGEVVVESAPGWGTLVTVTLPVGEAAELESRQPINAPTPLKVAVVDDHRLTREGICGLLRAAGLEVAGEAADGKQAIEELARWNADVLLLDIQMPAMDGIATLKEFKQRGISVPVLMLTSFGEETLLAETLKLGAKGVVLKDAPTSEIMAAIQAVRNGGTWLPPNLVSFLASAILSTPGAGGAVLSELSERENQILAMVAAGKRNREIARALYLSEKTVEGNLKSIFNKLGTSNRTEAARIALERHLISMSGPSNSGR